MIPSSRRLFWLVPIAGLVVASWLAEWNVGSESSLKAQDEPRFVIALPILPRGADLRRPESTWTPSATREPSRTPTPDSTPTATRDATAGPSPTPSPTVDAGSTPTPATGPGIPACDAVRGDAGGLRFSRDGGASLAPGARPLDAVAYTWAIDIDPRDPDVLLELHQGALYRSEDAGCTFDRIEALPEGAWDRLTRAPSRPELWVLSSIFESRLAWTEDDGASWQTESLPDDVHVLVVDPLNPWGWTFAGRQPQLYRRDAAGEKFDILPLDIEGVDSLVSAAVAPGDPGRWIVGSSLRGLFRSTDGGASWAPASEGLFGDLGEPAEPVTAVVPSWITIAASDPRVAFAVVNRVARSSSQRAIWRSEDGGATWQRRVGREELAALSELTISGGTRVFIDPYDPDRVLFGLGVAFGGYGTDLFRSADGLSSLAMSHFDDFFGVDAMAFGPAGSQLIFVGVSSNRPSLGP